MRDGRPRHRRITTRRRFIQLVGAGTLASSCAHARVHTSGDHWPATQLRVARPTAQMPAVLRFYRDGLGLPVLASFSGHAGYSGVMLGLPGRQVHLEFTEHVGGSPCPAPTKDNLLVLYIPERQALDALRARMADAGFQPVAPENPYWLERGTTFEDPDGWRVVLMNAAGLDDP